MNIRKLIASLVLAFALLPVAFASTEYKGDKIVNINKANAATFAAYFKKVGPNKAKAIEKYRKANGKFKSVADLNNVPGIGEETFKAIKKNASISRGESVPPKGFRMAETSGNTRSTKKPKRTRKTTSGDTSTGTERRSRRSSDSSSGTSRRSGGSSDSGSSSSRGGSSSSSNASRGGESSGSTPRKKTKAKDGDKKKKKKKKAKAKKERK